MAGRKEYELLFKLQAALGGNFSTSFKAAMETTRQLQNSMQRLNSTAGKIDSYKTLDNALKSNRQRLEALTIEHNLLQREMSQTEQPSEALRRAMERNERQIAATTARIEQQETRLQTLGGELSAAGIDTSNLAAENERLSRSFERVQRSQEEYARVNAAIQQNNEAISQTKKQLGGTIGTAAALGAAIYAGPVKKAAEFESQMSSVKSIIANSYGESPEGLKRLEQDMESLNALAKENGAITQFTAVEAGQALEYMGMAGWKAEQMTAGLPGVLHLAAASGEDLAQVSDIVTDAMTALGIKAEEDNVAHFADVLAAAATSSNTTVSGLGESFKYAAATAGTLGYSAEDVAIALGTMANAGIKGSQAGTSLRTALSNMAAPTDSMKAAMDQLGISMTNEQGDAKSLMEVMQNLRNSIGDISAATFDEEGNARDLNGVISELSKTKEGLSKVQQIEAASTIFGKNAMAGMLSVIGASEKDFQDLTNSIYGSAGAAEAMAAIKQDNLEGDITLMKSAVDGLQIAIGDALLPTFREGTQRATELISKLAVFINENPELVRQIVKITAGLLGLKAAALAGKLGFLELKGGVLAIRKGVAGLKSIFALASANSIGFAGRMRGVAGNVSGYFGNIGSAAGGVGRTFAQTFGGTRIGRLVSKTGGAVGGAFSKVFSGVGGMAATAAGRTTSVFARAGTTIAAGPLGKIGGVIGKGFGKLAPVFAPLQKLGGAILGPFSGVLGKILPVVGVFAVLIATVQLLRDNMDKVRGVIEKVFGAAGLAAFDKVLSVVANIGNTIKNIFSDGNLANARESIRGIFGDRGAEVFDTFVSIVKTVGNVIGQMLTFIDGNVKPVIGGLFDFITGTVLPQIAQAFIEWGPSIGNTIQSIWEIVQTVATAVMGVISVLMPTLQGLVGTGLETIKAVVGGVLEAIQGLFSVFAGVFTGDWTRVWEGVKSIFSGIWDSITGIAKGALNGIIDIINGLVSGLGKIKIPDWVPGIGGKGMPKIDPIPKFAKGTLHTPDTFIAGEAGAELITNAKNRTVFKAAETGNILSNIASMAKSIVAPAGMQQPRLAYAGMSNSSVEAPAVLPMGRQETITIHSAPVFHIGSEAQAQDIEEILRKRDEGLIREIEERERQRAEDERRCRYD